MISFKIVLYFSRTFDVTFYVTSPAFEFQCFMCAHDVGSNEKLFYKEFLAKIAFVGRGWVGAMPGLQQAGRDSEVVGGAVELALARLLALVLPPGHSAPEHRIATLDTSRVNGSTLDSRPAKTAILCDITVFTGPTLYALFCRPPCDDYGRTSKLTMHCVIL